jgi:cobalamin synthase
MDELPETPHAKAASEISQEELRTKGQRRVNIIWEITQALIAMGVTGQALRVSGYLAMSEKADVAAFLLLSNAFFLVIGFYFGRTNHQRVGGIGGDSSIGGR